MLGVLGRLLQPLGALTNAPNLARHGVILPFAWFGGLALLQIWEGRLTAALKGRLRRGAWTLMALTALIIVLIGIAFQPLISAMRPLLDLPPADPQPRRSGGAGLAARKHAGRRLARGQRSQRVAACFRGARAQHLRAVQYFEWDLLEQAASVAKRLITCSCPLATTRPTTCPWS